MHDLMNEEHPRWPEYRKQLAAVVYPVLDGISDSNCHRDFRHSRRILATYEGVNANGSCDVLERNWACECEMC